MCAVPREILSAKLSVFREEGQRWAEAWPHGPCAGGQDGGRGEISSNTTITVTLSNGKKESSKKVEERKNNTQPTNNSSTNNNSNTNNNSGNSGNSGGSSTPSQPQQVDCSCSIRPAQIQIELDKYDNCSSAASGLRDLVKCKCPNVNISVSCVNADDSYGPGQYYSGYNGGSTNSCSLSTQLAK